MTQFKGSAGTAGHDDLKKDWVNRLDSLILLAGQLERFGELPRDRLSGLWVPTLAISWSRTTNSFERSDDESVGLVEAGELKNVTPCGVSPPPSKSRMR